MPCSARADVLCEVGPLSRGATRADPRQDLELPIVRRRHSGHDRPAPDSSSRSTGASGAYPKSTRVKQVLLMPALAAKQRRPRRRTTTLAQSCERPVQFVGSDDKRLSAGTGVCTAAWSVDCMALRVSRPPCNLRFDRRAGFRRARQPVGSRSPTRPGAPPLQRRSSQPRRRVRIPPCSVRRATQASG